MLARRFSRFTSSVARPQTSAPRSAVSIRHGTTTAHSNTEHKGSDGGPHGDHYDAPGGWLWGIRPGEKYEKEGWENLFYFGFVGSFVVATAAYIMKEDTS